MLMEVEMTHFVGLDASKQTTSICVMDGDGNVVKEGAVETDPSAIIRYLRGQRRRYRRIGLESTGFASWLYEGLAKAGLPIICIEAAHAQGVLKARLNKTDRNDAKGIAELMRVGIYKAVHVKTRESQDSKLLLATRTLMKRKLRDIDNFIRAALLRSGLKIAAGATATFGRRATALLAAAADPFLSSVVEALLGARDVLLAKVGVLEAHVAQRVKDDPVCQRFMTVPGVAALTALAFRSAIDVPGRFPRSRSVGVHLGLTPRAYRSGTISRQGGISKCGDRSARSALFIAATVFLTRSKRPSRLQAWGQALRARKAAGPAIVAVARKLAIVLHRMWLDGSDFDDQQSAA
jgi:transposase